MTELTVICATVGESCTTTRSHVVLFRFFGTSHERSNSTKNGLSRQVGIRTSWFTDFQSLLCLSVCTQCSYLALRADLALRIKKYPSRTGGAAHGQELHYAVTCISVFLQHTWVSHGRVCKEYRHDPWQQRRLQTRHDLQIALWGWQLQLFS